MDGLVKIDERILKPIGLQLPDNLNYDDWMNLGNKLRLINNACLWWWGDWINFGEQKYGEKYSQALEESDYSYGGLANASYIAREFEFSRRRENIPISFYQEIASLTEEEQDKLLDECEENNWKQRDLREAARRCRIEKKYSELPEGKFQVFYADPPWQYDNSMPSEFKEQANHYQLMSIDEIAKLKIKDLADKNAVLFLWVTSPILEESFLKIIHVWGFEYKTSFIWDKINHVMGHYNSVRHEFLLLCIKGSYPIQNRKLYDSVYSEKSMEHSQKPEYYYKMIEDLYPNSNKIELFARDKREGWTSYGNQI